MSRPRHDAVLYREPREQPEIDREAWTKRLSGGAVEHFEFTFDVREEAKPRIWRFVARPE